MQNSESESKTLLSVLEVAERLNISASMVRAPVESGIRNAVVSIQFEPVERSIAFSGTGNPQTPMESAMQPKEIVQTIIGACEHIVRAKSLIETDAICVNAPSLLGYIPHVQPTCREDYCLWKHVGRISEEIALHQSLIGISLDELNAIDGWLYDNMPFPGGIYDSELRQLKKRGRCALESIVPLHASLPANRT